MVREPWPSWVSRNLMTCPSPTGLVGLAICHPEAETVRVKTLPCEALTATDPPAWVNGTTAGEYPLPKLPPEIVAACAAGAFVSESRAITPSAPAAPIE